MLSISFISFISNNNIYIYIYIPTGPQALVKPLVILVPRKQVHEQRGPVPHKARVPRNQEQFDIGHQDVPTCH